MRLVLYYPALFAADTKLFDVISENDLLQSLKVNHPIS
jgi:hypothetical protein